MAINTQGAPGVVHPLRREVLLLLQVAIVVFTWTVVIGILNGTDVVDFSRKVVLSHVHAGTLGWITMCVFAASLWLFGGTAGPAAVKSARVLTGAAIVVLPAFAFTFALTFGDWRPIMGSFALATIVGFFVWVLFRTRGVELSVTHVGFLAAIATSVAGGTIGVLLATKIATGRDVVPSGADDAHPGTMVVGFLIPVGMALAEWCFNWPKLTKAQRLGQAQIVLPFLGGLILLVSLLFDIKPLAPVSALVELAGVVVFIKRLWPNFRAVEWMQRSTARFAAASGTAIVVNILFINYLIARHKGDFDKVPDRHLLALDHTMFVGVLTNAILGLLLGVTRKDDRWKQADDVVFYGMNAGLIGFVISLLGDWIWLERIATPIMGASILTALVVFTLRLRTRNTEDAVFVGAAAAPGG
jgi:hypothetical protein